MFRSGATGHFFNKETAKKIRLSNDEKISPPSLAKRFFDSQGEKRRYSELY